MVPFDLDQPSVDGIERGRPKHRARPEVETRVMERAADRRTPADPVGRMPTVMRTGTTDREQFAAQP